LLIVISAKSVESEKVKALEAAESDLRGSIDKVLNDFSRQKKLKNIEPVVKQKKLPRKKKVRKQCRKLSRSIYNPEASMGQKTW